MTKYDLLLKGGHLIDTDAGIDEIRDVAFAAGRVAAVDANIPPDTAREVVDASGSYVAPGLVDMHVHAFIHGYDVGLELDGICTPTGVTTVCDGGSTGAVNFQGMKEYVIARSETRVLAYLNISAIGMTTMRKSIGQTEFKNLEDYVGISEYRLIDYSDPQLCADIINANRDTIVGVKVREQIELVGTGNAAMEPLHRGLRAAEMTGTPIMIHWENPPIEYTEVMPMLRPGDVVTHVYNGHGSTIVGPDGKLKAGVHEARRRGIIFEVGYGQFHFSFDVARRALKEGFYPDAISTDMSRRGHRVTVKDLPTTLSKFLCLGMPFKDVVRCATSAPARILGRGDELGTLRVGAVGDAAVFRIETGRFPYEDTHGETIQGEQKWTPQMTVRAGRVVWRKG
jgi:dihydroorotase